MAIGSPQWMYKSGEAYTIDQSLRWNNDDTPNLEWTPSTASTRKKWTFSFWVKPSMIDSSDKNPVILAVSNTSERPSMSISLVAQAADNALHIEQYNGSSYDFRMRTTPRYRDPSAWYHMMIAFDTTQGTDTNRLKMYVNGEQITNLDLSVYPSQDHQTACLNTKRHRLGNTSWTDAGSEGDSLDGYLAEVNMIDGQQLTPADFGETGDYGEWKPIEYSGTYGTNGFYLPFKADYEVEGFSTVTYKGTNANQYIGGTGFKPDLTWLKRRDSSAGHMLYDSIRGVGRSMSAQSTGAENVSDGGDDLTAFNTDGFSLGPVHQGNSTNVSGGSIVAWNWDMGADTPTGFSAVTYKGNGGTQYIGGTGFQPDLTWIKPRSVADNNVLFDAVRGYDRQLKSNGTDAEDTHSPQKIGAASDGFTIDSTDQNYNSASHTYVAWNWDMGGSNATNTTGDIDSTVRANPVVTVGPVVEPFPL